MSAAGRIIVLDEVTTARIAAGEIVERPASVVKELVENSLDAGATRVEVEIENGGLDLVKVADNGEGMGAADAVLAFERHATSKLRQARDLECVATYGFRGEALPSIGAVSKVRLLTAGRGDSEGVEIRYEGGRLVSAGPGAARSGTVVWVRDLFYNTPARRAAARSSPAEAARVAEVVTALALGSPGVAFSLVSGGRQNLVTPGTGRLEDVLSGILGAKSVRDYTTVAFSTAGIGVTGLAGLPAAARRDSRRQYLFCNGRATNPHILRKAVDEAYRGLLETGRTPVFVLHLHLPPGSVDVNIHPAKTHVRFRDHGLCHRAVLFALKAALESRDLFPGRLAGAVSADQPPGPAAGCRNGLGAGGPSPGQVPVDWRSSFGVDAWGYGGRETRWDRTHEGPGIVYGPEAERPAASPVLPPVEPLGQVGDLFIVAGSSDGLFIIDQHAAHERIIYERLVDAGQTGGTAQLLAVPETLDVPAAERETLGRCLGLLRDAGFDIEEFGGGGEGGPATVIIRAVPAALAGVPAGRLLSDFLAGLAREGASAATDPAHLAKALAACKAALKAGEKLSMAEMASLIKDLGSAREPRTCPHGRPAFIKLTLGDVKRAFSRPPGTGRAGGP